jgi:NADP-dependent 3-hydroxy acid dehydrogenase YdfG
VLVAAGAKTTIAARDETRLKAAAETIRAGGNPCRWHVADVTNQADCAAIVELVLDELAGCAARARAGNRR